MKMIDAIRNHAQSYHSPYRGPAARIKGHRLPTDYWEVVQQSNGFVTADGLFRLFSVEQGGTYEVSARNDSEWANAYGPLLDEFVIVAEDIFGDLYGYQFNNFPEARLAKFYCEGGKVETCYPPTLPAFLTTRVLVSSPTAFDYELAAKALKEGLRPTVDEHLSFALPLLSGGSYHLENLGIESTQLHLGVLGQMSLAYSTLTYLTKVDRFTDDS